MTPAEELEILRKQNTELVSVIQARATSFFGQMIDAVNVRTQQAAQGDRAAREELALLAKLLDPDRLRAASRGLHVGG